MSLLLDTGAFIAFERGDRRAQAFLERASRDRDPVRTTTAVVAQVWRRPHTQARLARLLRGVEELVLDRAAARRIGQLLAEAGTADVVDASLIDSARDGDEILTGDVDDLAALARAARKALIITPI